MKSRSHAVTARRYKAASPIRWAGSKRALLSDLVDLVPDDVETYFEPFAGSACLFFALNPRSAVISDLNEELISFYRTLRSNHAKVSTIVQSLDVNGADYYWLRAVAVEDLTATQRAARFLYLNRFSFNGVYRTDLKGRFNVPRGKNTGSLPSTSDLARFGRDLRGVNLLAVDFEEAVSECGEGDFVYLDPPYFTRPNVTLGEYGYGALGEQGDLRRLGDVLRKLTERGARWLLSYSPSPTLQGYSGAIWKRRIVVTRNVGGWRSSRRAASEMLYANYTPV